MNNKLASYRSNYRGSYYRGSNISVIGVLDLRKREKEKKHLNK